MDLFVSTSGDDKAEGTRESPLATIGEAMNRLRKCSSVSQHSVFLREGSYFLKGTIRIGPEDVSGSLRISAYGDERPTISGGRRLDCRWAHWRDGIYVCDVPQCREKGLTFTQLFADGKRQIRARFPNADELRPEIENGRSGGYSLPAQSCAGYTKPVGIIPDVECEPDPDPDRDMIYDCEPASGIVFDPKCFPKKRWANPEEAVMHIFQSYYWGNLQWRIKAIDYEKNFIWFGEGGQQMGAKWSTEGSALAICRT